MAHPMKRLLGNAVWSVSFTLIVGPEDLPLYTSTEALAAGVSSDLSSASFASSLSTALSVEVAVSSVDVETITKPPPTPLPTSIPTLYVKKLHAAPESATANIIIVSSVSLVAILLSCAGVYLRYKRSKSESSKDLSSSAKRPTMNMLGRSSMDYDIEGCVDDDADIEMKMMDENDTHGTTTNNNTTARSLVATQFGSKKEKKSIVVVEEQLPPLSEVSFPPEYDTLIIDHKTELKLSPQEKHQDIIFTQKGVGKQFAGLFWNKKVTLRQLSNAGTKSNAQRTKLIREVQILINISHPRLQRLMGICIKNGIYVFKKVLKVLLFKLTHLNTTIFV
jgi:hypothetical protein